MSLSITQHANLPKPLVVSIIFALDEGCGPCGCNAEDI